MRALFLLLAAVFLLFPAHAVNAQVIPDGSAQSQSWTPIDNCPTANALGPQVYDDLADGVPNAAQEVSLLMIAVRVCQRINSAPQYDDSSSNGPSSSSGGGISNILQMLNSLEQLYQQYRGGTSGANGSGGSMFSSGSNTLSSGRQSSAGPSQSDMPSYATGRWSGQPSSSRWGGQPPSSRWGASSAQSAAPYNYTPRSRPSYALSRRSWHYRR